MYSDGMLRTFLDDLAARKPAPGGGSAAALSAAIGASLMLMVARYTIDHPAYRDAERVMADLIVKAANAKRRFEELIDQDVAAYLQLAKEAKAAATDPARLDQLYREALTPPYEICRLAAECLPLCAVLARHGNRKLITDTAGAAVLLEGAFFAAKYNVYINLKQIGDTEFIRTIHHFFAPLEETIPALKDEILELCEEVIAK